MPKRPTKGTRTVTVELSHEAVARLHLLAIDAEKSLRAVVQDAIELACGNMPAGRVTAATLAVAKNDGKKPLWESVWRASQTCRRPA